MSLRVGLSSFCLLILTLLSGITSVIGQDRKLVQLSGVVLSGESDYGVPYVSIKNESFRGENYMGNHQGYFSFVAHEGDTIHFTSIGYNAVTFIVPQNTDQKYTAFIRMTSKVMELEMVEPYPYASIEEFNQAFLALEIADDNEIIAKRNLSPESLAAMARTMPMNGSEMRVLNTNQQHIRLANRTTNERMANPLLNPFAWGNLIRQITEGNFGNGRNNW